MGGRDDDCVTETNDTKEEAHEMGGGGWCVVGWVRAPCLEFTWQAKMRSKAIFLF